MIFRKQLAEAVMRGEKTATRRRLSENENSPWWKEKCRYQVGRPFAVQPGRTESGIGFAAPTAVYKQPLREMKWEDARAEGFKDLAEFFETFGKINGDVDYDEIVWVVEFERWWPYVVVVPAGNTRMIDKYDAADVEAVREIVEGLKRRRSYWIVDQRSGKHLQLEDLR